MWAVARVAADVGVQQPDVESGPWQLAESQRQVLVYLAVRVADAVYHRPFRVLREHRLPSDLGSEAHAAARQLEPRFPAVQRVVVAVADEGADAGFIQAFQPVAEFQLRPQAAVGAVVHVACDQQRVCPLLDAQVDDVRVGVEGGAEQGVGNVLRRLAAHADKGAVQVEVGGVDELQ